LSRPAIAKINLVTKGERKNGAQKYREEKMTPKTTEELRNQLLASMQDLRDGKISNADAQAQVREANKMLRKLRKRLTSEPDDAA
jgi:hypothetical protein